MAQKYMSAEYSGHNEETTITGVFTSILLALLLIPMILEKNEELVQSLTAPQAAGHGGH